MENQNYLMLQNNVVINLCLWDGDTTTWQPPPADVTMLIQKDVSALVWVFDSNLTPPDYVLKEQVGVAGIGFTWDGTILTTNEPKPILPTPSENQPTTTGTTTI